MKNVLITGSFDLLHSGHITFLEEASRYGNLYVGIGSDKSIKWLKSRETICSQEERLFMVRSIKYVKDAWINEGMGNMDFIDCWYKHNVIFDTLVVNEDQDFIEKRQFASKHMIEYIVLKRKVKDGFTARSSTEMRENYGNKQLSGHDK